MDWSARSARARRAIPTVAAKRLHGEAVTAQRKQRVLPSQPAALSATASADPYGANILTRAIGAGRGFIGGIGQGIASTVLHADDLLRSAAEHYGSDPQPRPLADPNIQALITPQTTAAKWGKGLEQVAEFAVPGGAAARATKGLGVLSRAGAQTATAGTVAAAQDGGVSAATVPAVVTAGALPLAGGALRKGAELLIRGRIPQNLEALGVRFPFDRRNQWIRDEATGFRYRPKPRPESALKREHWVRGEATDDVLSAGLRGTREDVTRIENLLGDVRDTTAAERAYFEQLSRILASKQSSPILDLVGNVATGGVAVPASMVRRAPVTTAQLMDWLAQRSTPSAATTAGALDELTELLMQREAAKAGGQ